MTERADSIMQKTFYQWLTNQTDREDVVGDFAATMQQFEEPQATRKKANAHMKWATWLVDKNATSDVIRAFNLAWQEYQENVEFS